MNHRYDTYFALALLSVVLLVGLVVGRLSASRSVADDREYVARDLAARFESVIRAYQNLSPPWSLSVTVEAGVAWAHAEVKCDNTTR